jgi:CheY-like chemotaxis protein
MPELDGFAATAAIRRAESEGGRGQHTPIVALTADALMGDAENCRAAGMDDHLAKLRRNLRTSTWLSGRAQQPTLATADYSCHGRCAPLLFGLRFRR